MDYDEWQRHRKPENPKPIAFKDGTVAKENLPFPNVLYPGHYGTFLAFRRTPESPITFCSCVRDILPDPLRLMSEPSGGPAGNTFPAAVSEMISRHRNRQERFSFRFRDGLCHLCNCRVPSHRYCHEMYEGAFKQHFGWYVNQQRLKFGINGFGAPNPLCPEDLAALMAIDAHGEYDRSWKIQEEEERIHRILDRLHERGRRCELLRQRAADLRSQIEAIRTPIHHQSKAVDNHVENVVRSKLGFDKVGTKSTSETILYLIVRSLFPDDTVIRRHRPGFLERMELDVFVLERNLAFEYQGIQHYKPVGQWGGDEGLTRLQERDLRKAELCGSNGISLVHVTHEDGLNDETIRRRLRETTKCPRRRKVPTEASTNVSSLTGNTDEPPLTATLPSPHAFASDKVRPNHRVVNASGSIAVSSKPQSLAQVRRTFHVETASNCLARRKNVVNFCSKSIIGRELAELLLTRLDVELRMPPVPKDEVLTNSFAIATKRFLHESRAMLSDFRPFDDWFVDTCDEDQLGMLEVGVHPFASDDFDAFLEPGLATSTPRISTDTQSRSRPHTTVCCLLTIALDWRPPQTDAPKTVVVTTETSPTRLALAALSAVDCTYHFALNELIEAVKESKYYDCTETIETLLELGRLRDISDLPFDISI